MKTLVALFVIFVFCIFMGVTAISMGVGAAFPPINLVAQPVLCPDGQMVAEQSVRATRRGTGRILSASWTCVEPSGASTPIQGVSLVAGPIHGLCLFAGISPLVLLGALRKRSRGTTGAPY